MKSIAMLRQSLLSKEISGVLFIRDYFEIQCEDEPRLQFFVPPRVVSYGQAFSLEDERHAYKLIEIIGSSFADINLRGDDFCFSLTNGTQLLVKKDGSINGDTGAVFEKKYGLAEF